MSSETVKTEPDICVSSLVKASPAKPAKSDDPALTRIGLMNGVDLLIWKGAFKEPCSMDVHDDWNRLNFSYVLEGHSSYSLLGVQKSCDYELDQGMGCISYTPDCRGRSTFYGPQHNLSIALQPDRLHDFLPNMDMDLSNKLTAGHCFIPAHHGRDMQMTASALSQKIATADHGLSPHDRLWLLGQSLTLVSATLEACFTPHAATHGLKQADKNRLLRARDLLLADLTQAPTIAELAKETGLTIPKLKQGFRHMFNESVYGLFQKTRMQEAHRKLSSGNHSVMMVAADLGYTNASHFASAFQKQFGIKPSALKN